MIIGRQGRHLLREALTGQLFDSDSDSDGMLVSVPCVPSVRRKRARGGFAACHVSEWRDTVSCADEHPDVLQRSRLGYCNATCVVDYRMYNKDEQDRTLMQVRMDVDTTCEELSLIHI